MSRIVAKPPSLRWYLAYARLKVARALVHVTRERTSHALAAAAICMAILAGDGARQEAVQTTLRGGEVTTAWITWVIQIGIMIVAALISYAMRPKPKKPEAVKANIPIAEDGKGVRTFFGTVWVDDSVMLGFKQMGTEPIKSKGGKK